MYSIIQAFGINYAENSSIIKQIKKLETGDTAGTPSEGTGGRGQPDPAEEQAQWRRCPGADGEAQEAQERPSLVGQVPPLCPLTKNALEAIFYIYIFFGVINAHH